MFPAVSAEIKPALQQAQFASVRSQIPMLLSVAALNTIIIMAVCAHDGLPLSRYAWMSGLVLYCAIRVFFWMRRMNMPVEPQHIPGLLRMNVGAALFMITGLGVAATYTFVAGTFASHLLIPMSLGFGATSIAHCLYTLRPAAIGTVVMGLFPSSIAMLAVGSFDAKMLGIAMLSVGILMIRFVAAQYDQLVASLHLEKQNRDLANTDALTGLANRRAVMEILASPEIGTDFGVALLDLDGFKSVNDNMGHNAGDTLLQHVGQRLSAALDTGDKVGRLGGDEFIIIFKNLSGPEDISARSTAILAALCQPINISGARVPVAASLGHALHLQDGDSVDALLLHADKALYAAKRAGRSANASNVRHRAA
jgi:diguanylate cyclase (GGDEF)-like protein